MTRIIVLIASAGLLAGCAQSGEPAADLAMTCQTRACTCTDMEGSIFDAPRESAVLWHTDGRAYCPKGQALNIIPPPPPKPGGIPLS